MRINYIIATYAGCDIPRRDAVVANLGLDPQLKCLEAIFQKKKKAKIPNYISQITVVCPEPREGEIEGYYKRDVWPKRLPVVYQEYVGKNWDFSYDQWLQAYEKYPDFDYYIMMEDDYSMDPDAIDFDSELVRIYHKKFPQNIGYLCQWATDTRFFPFHAAMSNGMVSRETFEAIGSPLKTYYANHTSMFRGSVSQMAFSQLFQDRDISIEDISDDYAIVHHHGNGVSVDSLEKPRMIIPIQYLLETQSEFVQSSK